MELTVNDLGLVQEEIFKARTKWYDIGLKLKVPVDKLDSIQSQFSDPKVCLRETLKVWLKIAGKTTWKTLVDALRSQTVDESWLAARLEEKYCVETLVKKNKEQACQTQDLDQEVIGLQTEIQQLKQQLQKARAQNLQEESDVARRTRSYSEIQCLRQDLETRDQQLQEKDQLQVVLEASSQHEIQQLRQEVAQQNHQIQESQAERFQAEQALDRLQQTEEVRQSEIQQLRHELKVKDCQVQETEEVIKAQQCKIQQFKHELESRDLQLQDKDRKIQEKDEALVARQRETEELRLEAQQALDHIQQTVQVKQSEIQQLRHELKDRDCQVQETKKILKAKIQQFKQKLESKDQQLQAQDRKIQVKDETLVARQQEIEELRLEQHAAEAEKSPVTKKRRQNEYLHLQTREQPQAEDTRRIQKTFICKELSNVPSQLQNVSSAVIDGKMVYVSDDINMYAYDLDKMGWSMLPDCPHTSFSLAVVKGQLTTIGGYRTDTKVSTNSLLSLTRKTIGRTWSEQFLPMPTACAKPAVACIAKALIVAGGYTDRNALYLCTDIEVMNTETEQWFIASRKLEEWSSWCTITTTKDLLYIDTTRDHRKQMIACYITDLLQLGSSQGEIWHSVSSILADKPTIATIRGQLIGIREEDKDNDEIHLYDPKIDSWKVIGNAPTAQFKPKEASLQVKKNVTRPTVYVEAFSGNGLIIVVQNKTPITVFIPDFD